MTRAKSFGPSALATPANAITVARLVLSPPLWALIVVFGPSWVALPLWIVLAATDGLDGYIARRMGTTRSGAFLDPLADKALVLGAMWAIVAAGGFWWLPVALITVRELAISLFRWYWSRRGLAVPARFLAKVKTIVQAIAVGFALLPPVADHDDLTWIVSAWLWAAVVLTLVTGVQYMLEGSRATTAEGVRA
ncbi:MAG TPA: CDP-alcohol phosphatidyltransferase family protein [Acidimicrobiales bacterium]|nr:CDP-alcohol phosphatidyltransferase family protein [Acidimicrobiales bacterium]